MPDDGTSSKMSKASWRDAMPPDAPSDEEIIEEIRKSKNLEKENGAMWHSAGEQIEPTASRSSRKSTGSRVGQGVRKISQGLSNMLHAKKIGPDGNEDDSDAIYGTGSLKLQSAVIDKGGCVQDKMNKSKSK
mmetsp:Transcript_25202/g.57973  ORF Transcript_25202/g.57973 Transcript_25202/m.57973 type:complete len:132 (+) Transcript_25202:110-505(+)